ncbi:uncharacterized protein PG986_006984 [Apiospora aurea]|uniref:Gfo/Idh/MocA-like oxidoreductase N-terminal domain-containing protein n=1 Tax=Apiospora aurea TaxID=335848 RepID=A0ABR1QC07_9PEZI
MAPLGVAIIGGGIFVKEEHLPAVLACPQLSLKAIWSRSLKSAQDTANLIPGDASTSVDLYSSDSGDGKSFEDVLKRADITGLIMALPITEQPAYIEKALAAGKHVLAEKPIAKDVETAKQLIATSQKLSAETKATLSIAENFRFIQGYTYGAEQVKQLGKVTGFVVRVSWSMQTDNKYLNTAWRAKPEKLLGPENAVDNVIAQTSLIQSYLPPVDSINAVLKTKSNVVGSFIFSVGTTLGAFDYLIACENGSVQAEGGKVVTTRGAGPTATREEKAFEKSNGVKEEVIAWAESMASGTPNPQQAPEMALADLELLEGMLTSGDKEGERQKLKLQHYV